MNNYLASEKHEKTMSVDFISPSKFRELCENGKKIELIDVRTPVEFREMHIDIAQNVPLDQLDPEALMRTRDGLATGPFISSVVLEVEGNRRARSFSTQAFQTW